MYYIVNFCHSEGFSPKNLFLHRFFAIAQNDAAQLILDTNINKQDKKEVSPKYFKPNPLKEKILSQPRKSAWI